MEAFFYFLLWIAIGMLALRLGMAGLPSSQGRDRALGPAGDHRGRRDDLRWVPPETDIDPVCGRTLDPARAKPSVYDGCVYYFCSRECREQFETAPGIHLKKPTGDQHPQTGRR